METTAPNGSIFRSVEGQEAARSAGPQAPPAPKPARVAPTAEERAAAKEQRKQVEKERLAASNEAWFARTQEEIREAIRKGDDPERVMQFTTEKALTWLTTKLKAKLPRAAADRTRDVRRKAIVEAIRAQMAQEAATPTPADRAPDTRTPDRPATGMGNVDAPTRPRVITGTMSSGISAKTGKPIKANPVQWRTNRTGQAVDNPSQPDIVRGNVVLTDPDAVAEKLRRAGSRDAAMAHLEKYQGAPLRAILRAAYAQTPSPLGEPSLGGRTVAELRRMVFELLYGREADSDAIGRVGGQQSTAARPEAASGGKALKAAPLRISGGRLASTPAGVTPARAEAMTNALESYRDIGFSDLNRDLRNGQASNVTAARTVAGLDEAMAASPLSTSVVTYRGLSSLPPGVTGKSGDTWTDAAYASTTVDLNTAKGFGRGGAVLRLRVPAGVGGVQLSDMPGWGKADEREGELLLQRGLVHRIVGTSTVDGVTVYDVEVVPGPVAPIQAKPARPARPQTPSGLPRLRRR